MTIAVSKHCKNLDYTNFIDSFEEYESKNLIEHCFITELLLEYPEVENIFLLTDEIINKRNENKNKIKKIIHFLINQDYLFFDHNILKRKTDEVIIFDDLYSFIGYDTQNYEDGNTILHYQCLGLNLEGVKHLLSKNNISLDIFNDNYHTALECLFLEESDSYKYDSNNKIKKEITLLIKNKQNKDTRPQNENSLLFKTIDYQLLTNNINYEDLFTIIDVFKIFNIEIDTILCLIKKKYIKEINSDLNFKSNFITLSNIIKNR